MPATFQLGAKRTNLFAGGSYTYTIRVIDPVTSFIYTAGTVIIRTLQATNQTCGK